MGTGDTAGLPGHETRGIAAQVLSGVREAAASVGWEAVPLAFQCALLVITRVLQNRVMLDDAYIHFHNARNWAEGNGLVFNAGEITLATTSPVYAVLLGVIHYVTGAELRPVALWFNFFCDCAILFLTWAWLRRAALPVLFRQALLFVLCLEPARMAYSCAGMEESFFIVLVLIMTETLHRQRWTAAGLLLGALGWVRPEAIVVWIAVPAAMAVSASRSHVVRVLRAALPVALLFCLGLWAGYGTFMPLSLRAKSDGYWFRHPHTNDLVEFTVATASCNPLTALSGCIPSWGSPGDKISTVCLALANVFVAAAGVVWLWRGNLRQLAVFWTLFTAGYLVFYLVLNPPIFPWYYVPYFYGLLLLAGIGWWNLIAAAARRAAACGGPARGDQASGTPPRRRTAAVTAAVLTVMLVGASVAALGEYAWVFGFHSDGWKQKLSFRFDGGRTNSREPLYVKAAREMNSWIGDNTRARVGCSEVGVFGYHFRGHVLDSFGLVSPEVVSPDGLAAARALGFRHPVDIYVVQKPEFIMTDSQWLPERPAAFRALYDQIMVPDIRLLFFARKDVPVPASAGPRKPS